MPSREAADEAYAWRSAFATHRRIVLVVAAGPSHYRICSDGLYSYGPILATTACIVMELFPVLATAACTVIAYIVMAQS